MEDFRVLSVLKKFMSEEQYKVFEEKSLEFETELNKDITKYVDSNTPNKDNLLVEARKLAHSEVIEALGIKDITTVEQLNEHMKTVKLSSTDQANELTRLTTELKDKTTEYDIEVANRTQLESDAKVTKQIGLVKGLNISTFNVDDKDHVEFLRTKFEKEITDKITFEDVVKTYQEANVVEQPKRFGDPRFTKPQIVSSDKVEDVGAVWREMREQRNPKRK